MADDEEEVPSVTSLQPCKICARTFLPGPLAKHVKICEKNASKRRKVFNSLRQRVEGTDLARFHLPVFKKPSVPTPQKTPNAKSVHGLHEILEFTNEPPKTTSPAARHAAAASHLSNRGSNVSIVSSAASSGSATEQAKSQPPSPQPQCQSNQSKVTDRLRANISMNERCPHCERQFGPKSYDRHVVWCQEKHACLPDNSNHLIKQEAKERLEARIKYRAPPVNKRTVKEKYQSPGAAAAAKEEPKSSLQRGPSVRRTTGPVPPRTNPSTSSPGPSKGQDVQNKSKSEQRSVKRGVPAAKSKPITSEYNNNNNNLTNSASVTYNPFLTAERQLMELLECNDFTPYKATTNSKNKTPKSISPYLDKPSITSTPKANTRKSVIDPPTDFKDPNRTPADDIDFELLENFINDNFGNDDLMHKLDLDTISLDSCSTKAEHAASYFDDVSIDPRLINDFDNLSIPDHLDTHTTTTPDMLRQYPIASSKRFHDGGDSRYNRDDSLPVFYSMANVNNAPVPKPAKGTKSDKALKSETEIKISPKQGTIEEEAVTPQDTSQPSAEMREYFMELGELFSPGDEIYEEYKMLEQIYIVERSQNTPGQKDNSAAAGVSADSAYGRSPKTKIRSKVMQLSPLEQPSFLKGEAESAGDIDVQQDSAEANAPNEPSPTGVERGGGEGGIGIAPKRKPIERGDGKSPHPVAMFCHQCGKKYPVEAARFCVWCGNKRLVL